MDYKFLDNINTEELKLPETLKINNFLLKNHYAEAVKAIDFFASDGKLLYIHGFLGTGKRQFINYISDFLNKDVIKLEYHCKASTVSDDILLAFIDKLEKNSISKALVHTAKITTLNVKFQQYISAIKKPFVIILHSFDDISPENRTLVVECMSAAAANPNVKIVLSTRAMIPSVLGDINVDRKIFLKPLSKEIFTDYIKSSRIQATDDAINDFYKYSRGYYYYTVLSVRIIQSMKISLNEFISKYAMSGMSFDSYIGFTYVNLVPKAIRNFFWFLCSVRHGISLNALAVLELYDDFSIGYLKNNLMIYEADEMLYVQDYFQHDVDISIPVKTEIKLHKYIISIYEKELKEPLQTREILISRQALRAEIGYHTKKISELENKPKTEVVKPEPDQEQKEAPPQITEEQTNITNKMETAKKYAEQKKYTDAIEIYRKITQEFNVDFNTLAEIRTELARLYFLTNEYETSQHYYELAENYYKKNDEFINLNYLYYEMAELYYMMYKNDRAEETIKKVIYSVDTPQSLLVDACVRLGNIYSNTKKPEDAYKYYIKALESVDENINEDRIAELYFKLALVCEDMEDTKTAFEYYNKCIQTGDENKFKSLAYSNLGACYFESENYEEAEKYFLIAHEMEKAGNNYDGIYYAASYLAKIYVKNHSDKAIEFLIEAKQNAEFVNDDFYILESTIALGDYYYNCKDKMKKALAEYFSARKTAQNLGGAVDITKIEERINDMKLRIPKEEFEDLERKYE